MREGKVKWNLHNKRVLSLCVKVFRNSTCARSSPSTRRTRNSVLNGISPSNNLFKCKRETCMILVPRNLCYLETRTVQSPWRIQLLMMTVQSGLFLKSKHSDGCSAILYCSTKTTQTLITTLNYWRHFLDIVNIFQIWSTLAGCQELAVGFEPSRNGEIFSINNKWAYLRWMLFTSSSLNGRILPDKNTNALSPSSPGIISFIEMPSANVTSLFSRSCITPCLRWAEQQIRYNTSGIPGPFLK